MGRMTAPSDFDFYDEQNERMVKMPCECGAPVYVPYRDGPPLGPLRCDDCQEMHDQIRSAACGIVNMTTRREGK